MPKTYIANWPKIINANILFLIELRCLKRLTIQTEFLYDSGSQTLACTKIMEAFVKTQITGLYLQSLLQ